jgi:hypothetical protein
LEVERKLDFWIVRSVDDPKRAKQTYGTAGHYLGHGALTDDLPAE